MKHKGIIQDEGIVSARLMVDMSALWSIMDNGGRATHDEMQSIGFTTEAVEKLMRGGYNKICSIDGLNLYSYDGYSTVEGLVMLYVTQGGEGYRLAWNKEMDSWLVSQITSGYSLRSIEEI